MEGFLEDKNNCGQVLLHLVSRGNAIIAELLRLKDFIPPFFRPNGADEIAKWENVIYDFAYFKDPVEFDQATMNNPKTQALYEEIQDNHLDLIDRFYVAFESIHKFVTDINNYVDDLEEGAYIQQNLESVFKNEDGSQLLCEAVYLYGVMLLVLDLHIPGNVREKILVSYYRYSGKKTILGSNVDDVCKMLRSTGHGPTSPARPPLFPESYFKRVPLRQKLVDLVMDGLRSEDMYHQITAFPSLEHRTTALASQAAMLFVCLFFKSDWLDSQTAKMRNIVDKYFPDNWVISIYMGISVNLIDAWEPYKAAKAALANTIEAANVKQLIEAHAHVISTSLSEYKSEAAGQGPIPREKWSSYLTKKMNLLTKFNVTIRWLMLHSNIDHHLFTPGKQSIGLRNQIRMNRNFVDENQLELLLTTAELELKVKNMYKTLLHCREQYWNKSKKEIFERTIELKDLLSESNPVGRGKKDEQLSKWFGYMAGIIDTLDLNNMQDSTHKIVGIISALDGAKGHIETLGSKQLKLAEAELRQCLVVMVQGESVREQDLISLQIVADISYGWLLVDELSPRVCELIEREPEHVARLRALFLKLASAMEIPLLRINQAGSQDLMSVSQHYSDELVAYVRKVLHIIPQKMFELMLHIMHVRNEAKPDPRAPPVELILVQPPKKVDRYVQLKLAELTQRVAKFADGILQMKSTLVGVIEIDPKNMLEDGIRNELVTQISKYLESILQFHKRAKQDEMRGKLEDLSCRIFTLTSSLEYIQDFLSIYGLKIFQEEMNRVIGFNVDMESNVYLKEKVLPWQSIYQNKAIPIQVGLHAPKDAHCTFMGRLLAQLMSITNYRTTTYYPTAMSWFENKSRVGQTLTAHAMADLQLFDSMSQAICVSGLAALDRLVCYNIVSELQTLLKTFQVNFKEKNWLEFLGKISKELSPNADNISNPSGYYGSVVSRPHMNKLFSVMRQSVCRIGQLQLIRKHIFLELRTKCKFHSKGYFKALQNLNRALLQEVKDHFDDPNARQDDQLLSEVSVLVDWAGIGNTYAKIYVADQCPQFLALITFLYCIREIGQMKYDQRYGIFTCLKTVDSFDGHPFMLGVHTLLRQFHPEIWDQFSVYMGQCIRSHAAVCDLSKSQYYPTEVYYPIYLMRKLVEMAGLPRTALSDKIPKVVLDLYPSHIPLDACFVDIF